MFLSNFYKKIGDGLVNPGNKYQLVVCTDGSKEINISSGSSVTYTIASAMKNGPKTSVDNGSACLVLGTGTVPPALSDHDLSGSYVRNFSATTYFSSVLSEDDTYCEATSIMTVTNAGSEDVTIGEIGAVYRTAYKTVMYDRTLLDVPLTIPAGGIGKITYTIRMVYPTSEGTPTATGEVVA